MIRARASQSQARTRQLQTVFTAGSLEELATLDYPNIQLTRGADFEVEIDLTLPVAQAFNLAGAEAIFRPQMPDGLELIDVRGEGTNTVVITARIQDVAGLGQTAALEILPVLAAIGTFIGAHWLGLSLGSIFVFFAFGPLINRITGKTVVSEIGDFTDLAKWGAIALIALVGLNAIRTVKS